MTSEFLNFIDKVINLRKDDKILLAVSGGIDSMVMMHLFLTAGFSPGIAHCNFCLRGEDSDKDEELVRNTASHYNLPFYSKRFDTYKYAKSRGYSLQMAARELRYTWFEEIRKTQEYDYIAIGHNLDDNIETILINIIRGTGIAGLTGMKPVNGKLIRPLLFADRREISRYCAENNISFREDKSNNETKYVRNKLRHKIIPLLKVINPSINATLTENAARMNDAYELIRYLVAGFRKENVREIADRTSVKISRLKEWSGNSVFLYELFKTLGISNVPVKELWSVINGRTGSMVPAGEKRIIKNRDELIIVPYQPVKEEIFVINDLAGFTRLPFFENAVLAEFNQEFEITPDKGVAFLDYDRLKFPLTVRKWEKGDYFYPFGMNHRKKLSDYFTDIRISLVDKEKVYVLVSAGDIAWIMGYRTDNRFRITESTSRILILKTSASFLTGSVSPSSSD